MDSELGRSSTGEEAPQVAIAALERRIEQLAAELAVATTELEAFSHAVSHDLRAPLRALDGFSQRVLETASGKLDDEERDQLQRVRASAQRMSQLIDDLLALSRVARAPLTPVPVDVSAAATSLLGELLRDDPARAVEVMVVPGMRATADPRLLRVALDHLLRNAWKFTRKQPVARI